MIEDFDDVYDLAVEAAAAVAAAAEFSEQPDWEYENPAA